MSDRVDPNVYALSIVLDLDASAAFQTLGKFSQSVLDVEQKVAAAATAAMRVVSGLATTLNTSFKDIVGHAEKAHDVIKDTVQKQMSQYVKQNTKTVDQTKATYENLDKTSEMLDEILQAMTKANGLQDQWYTGHKTSHVGMRMLIGDMQDLDRQWDKMWGKDPWGFMYKMISDVVGQAKIYAKLQEDFVTNNYRMYGSMDGLVMQTQSLAGWFEVTNDAAVKAYKALVAFKTPTEYINKLTGSIARAARLTGVAETTLAQYTAGLRQTGLGFAQIDRQLDYAGDAMRKFGLNTDDVQKILASTTVTGLHFKTLFGDKGADMKIAFDRTKLAIAGMAKSLGASGDDFHSWADGVINDFVQLAIVTDQTGVGADNLGTGFVRLGQEIFESLDGIDDVTERAAQVQAMAGVFFKGNVNAANLATQLYEVNKGLGDLDLSKAENMQKLLEANAKKAEQYMTATQKFYLVVTRMGDAFSRLWNLVFTPLANALLPALRVLAFVLDGITSGLEWMYKKIADLDLITTGWTDSIKKWAESAKVALGPLYKPIEWLLEHLPSVGNILRWIADVAITGFIATFIFGLTGLGGWIGRIIGSLVTFGGRFNWLGKLGVNMFGTVGASARNFFLGIATTILEVVKILGSAVVEVALVIARVVVIIATGIAQAITIIGTSVLQLAAAASEPHVMLGLLVLSGVVLALAGAAWIMAQAFSTAVSALSQLAAIFKKADFVDFAASAALLVVGATSVGIAAGILFAATGPLLLAAGGIVISAALLARAGVGFVLFSASSSMLQYAANLLADAASKLSGAGTELLFAAATISAAASALVVSGWTLMMASFTLIPAAGGIKVGLTILSMAVESFSKTAVKLDRIAAAVSAFTFAFRQVKDVPIKNLRDTAQQVLDAIPTIEKMADEMARVSEKLEKAVVKFIQPIHKLTEALANLKQAAMGIPLGGMKLDENVVDLAKAVDAHVGNLEKAAARMRVAVEGQAVPALKAAQQAGFAQRPIPAETVNQIQVMLTQEGKDERDRMAEMAGEQLAALEDLNAGLASLLEDRDTDGLADIILLLKSYLPEMVRQHNLQSELNSWGV